LKNELLLKLRICRAKEVYLVTEPLPRPLAALGYCYPQRQHGCDIGGGTTDIAVISLGAEVTSQSLRVGGIHMEDAIIRHVKRVYNLAIGDRTRRISRWPLQCLSHC